MLDKAYLQFTSRYTHSCVFSYKPVPEGCTQDVNGMLLYISFNEKKNPFKSNFSHFAYRRKVQKQCISTAIDYCIKVTVDISTG